MGYEGVNVWGSLHVSVCGVSVWGTRVLMSGIVSVWCTRVLMFAEVVYGVRGY